MLIYRRPYREATILPSFTRIDVRSRDPWWFQDICNSVARGRSLAKKKTLGSSCHFRSGSMGFLLEMFVDAYQNVRVFFVFKI